MTVAAPPETYLISEIPASASAPLSPATLFETQNGLVSEKATISQLNQTFFQPLSGQITFTGAFTSPLIVNIIGVAYGSLQAITMQFTSGTTAPASNIAQIVGTLPSPFPPAYPIDMPMIVVDNGVEQLGRIQITPGTGQVVISATPAAGEFSGTGIAGFRSFAITFFGD